MSIVRDQQQAAEEEWLEAWLRGPTRTAWTAIPPQIGTPAPDVTLPDTTGRMRHRYQYCEDFPPKTVMLGAIETAKRSF